MNTRLSFPSLAKNLCFTAFWGSVLPWIVTSASAQTSTSGLFADLKIQPIGQTQPMTLSAVSDGLNISNPIGNISLELPVPNAQPTTNGIFGIFKKQTSGPSLSILDIRPGATTDIITIFANTTIHGSTSISGALTVNGTLQFAGAGSISSPYPGAAIIAGNYGVSATNYRAVAIGGSNGVASGDGAVLIGGGSSVGQNIAAGQNSTIIGSDQSVANSIFSTVLSASSGKILGTGSTYSAIIGGSGNQMTEKAGDYNVILGGGGNTFTAPASMQLPRRGGFASAIIAGSYNKIDGGHYGQAIIAGDYNVIARSRGSAILAGSENKVLSRDPADSEYESMGDWGQNAIVGGRRNTISQDSAMSVSLGGEYNVISGWGNAALGSGSANISGTFNAALGHETIASGYAQAVMGYRNVADSGKALIIGNGASSTARSNALTVDFNGNVEAKGKVKAQTVETSTVIITADTSDISMGVFTAQ